eukprot:c18806_g2_i1.p1 GENE.c18806_g2_i1~~c18806_g2_i1.p1  ORF type:complete len:194 (+),score=47.46 c18806_g2_i1:26-583(+)
MEEAEARKVQHRLEGGESQILLLENILRFVAAVRPDKTTQLATFLVRDLNMSPSNPLVSAVGDSVQVQHALSLWGFLKHDQCFLLMQTEVDEDSKVPEANQRILEGIAEHRRADVIRFCHRLREEILDCRVETDMDLEEYLNFKIGEENSLHQFTSLAQGLRVQHMASMWRVIAQALEKQTERES